MQNITEKIDFSKWTERASSSGKLNTNPVGKTPLQKYDDCLSDIAELEGKEKLIPSQQQKLSKLKQELPTLKERRFDIILSQTAKSHLNEVYWRFRTGTKKDIHSGYIENGKLGEPDGIKLVSQLDDPDLFEMGTSLYKKCELPRQFGSHFEGECDIHYSPTIQDIKCCWDIDTYYPHINELIFSKELDSEGRNKSKFTWDGNSWVLDENNIENDDYECQGIVYMELYGMSEFWLRYCLVNMPQAVMDQQVKSILWEYAGHSEEAQLAIDEFKKKHNFDLLPINLRVTTFKIKRNNEKYLDLCKRVEKAREYLNWYSGEMFYLENPGLRPNPRLLDKGVLEEIEITANVNISLQILDEENKPLLDEKGNSVIIIPISETTYPTTESIEFTEIQPDNTEGDIVSENATEGGYKDDAFPEVLDSISKDEIPEKVKQSVEVWNEAIKESNSDDFISKIKSISTIEDINAFYMENADKIDDTEYEPIFLAHRDSLFPKPEAPKVQKVKSPVTSNPIQEQTKKEYDGSELYEISDGIKVLFNQLNFDSAKSKLYEFFTPILNGCTERTQCRDAITVFYLANKELIDRFKPEFEDFSKKKYDELVDKQRREIEEMVKKM